VVDDGDFSILDGEIRQYLSGVVGTGVVDEDDLVIHADLLKDRGQTLVHLGDRRRITVACDDRAQFLL
jgi:hypothetical protein